MQLQSFARNTKIATKATKDQTTSDLGEIEKASNTYQQENIKLREASNQQEFYGLPLKKMAPQSEQDLLFKLNQKFNSAKDLLNFFESNRELFAKTPEAFTIIFSKLVGFKYSKRE